MTRRPRTASRLGGFTPLAAAAVLVGAGCAGRSPVPPAPTPLDEAEWRALAAPRPDPLQGATRLSLAGVEVLADARWPAGAPVAVQLGVTELVAAGLLRRADVRLVERRRFTAAVEDQRIGRLRPMGAPAAGTSPGAELTATLAWAPLADGASSLEVRIIDTATGRVVRTARSLLPEDAEPIGVARAGVGAIISALGGLGRLPAWDDPVAGSAPEAYAASGVSQTALVDFLNGLAAEEAWRWEDARVAYQAAVASRGFFEAEATLARTARLRLGGTLGES